MPPSGSLCVGADTVAPGSIITGFDIQVPLNDETCRNHIASSLARSLPEAVSRRPLVVIANGPSARDVDLRSITAPTLALNGAMQLFIEQGTAPTFWAGCDPQEYLATLLPNNPPHSTQYFVASKCHPAVFDKLRGCGVRVWHLADHPVGDRQQVALCSSVTLSAAWLMVRLGFNDFEFYGWDGCFIDGKDHAANGNPGIVPTVHINYGGTVQGDEIVGGRTFATSRTWAAEAHGVEQFAQLAKYFGIGVKIHGDGMFKQAHEAILGDSK